MTQKSKEGRNVPNLRFPGFGDEWTQTTLRACSESLEYGMNSAATTFDGENKYLRITDIDEASSKYIPNVPVSPEGDLEDKYLVKENDILFARTGASTGKSYLYNINDGKLYFAGFLIKVKVNYLNNANFIFNQTKTNHYQKWVTVMSMRSGQPGINSKEYASFKFWIPSKSEQDKIASFLTVIDKRIETQSKIIRELQSLKISLQRKIFTQELKLSESHKQWHTVKLRDLGSFFSGGTPLTTKKQYYDGDIPFIKSGEINSNNTEQFISEEGLKNSSAKLIESGDLIYALYGATSGEVGISKIDGAINQAVLCIRTNMDNIFLFNFLVFNKERILKTYLQGGQGNLSAEIIKSLEVPYPHIQEQQKIASIFSAIDDKIVLETELLGQFMSQKQYFLQNLFI